MKCVMETFVTIVSVHLSFSLKGKDVSSFVIFHVVTKARMGQPHTFFLTTFLCQAVHVGDTFLRYS